MAEEAALSETSNIRMDTFAQVHATTTSQAGGVEDEKCGFTMWSRKQMMQACIMAMAVVGAVVGTMHMISNLPLLQADNSMQVMNRAASAAYRRPQILRVGGPDAVFQVPSSPDFFTSWAASISFRLGDVIHIVGASSGYKLYNVPDRGYVFCNFSTTWERYWDLNYTYLDAPFITTDLYIQLRPNITTYYFIQGDDLFLCMKGMKFAATVNPMDIAAALARPNVNVPTRQPLVFEVGGDNATWTIPSKTNFYEDWASNISFIVGDILSFTISSAYYEVYDVPYTEYEMCRPYDWYWHLRENGIYQFTEPGIKYFQASMPEFCIQGMRFIANIYEIGNTSTPTPSPTFSPPETSSPPSSPSISPSYSPPTSLPNHSFGNPPPSIPPMTQIPATSENK